MERANRVWRAIVLLVAVAAAASAADPEQTVRDALRARSSGEYGEAERLLRDALTQAPARSDVELLLAETLAWDKHFGEAEGLYRALIARMPRSQPSRLGLARVLLWKGDYAEAQQQFDVLIRENARDADAFEGRATAAYWSGDFRAAARGFNRALSIDPSRDLSRRSLAEISAATAPQERVSVGYADDDQPYRLLKSEASAAFSSDPMTRWTAAAGAFRTTTPVYGRASLPFVQVGNETVLPSLRLTASPTIGLLRYADGVVRPTGGLALTRHIFANSRVVLSAVRRELLATATSMTTHPSVSTFSAGWRRESNDGWLGAADASILRYFDANRGTAAYAYALAPILRRGDSRLYAGASATYRDSRESRFSFAAVSSTRIAPNDFAYAYDGTYAPYWTPQRFREARAVIVAQTKIRSVALKLHVDGGIACDRAVAFGPDEGTTPLPSSIHSFTFERRFHPYGAELTAAIAIGADFRAEVGVESISTVFYRAKSFHASLVRHR
jgi:Tetratricopeptide repeat